MSAFVDSLHEVFEGLGRIQARRMFGGHGIYHEGRMFALVLRDTLYLKADAETAALFDALALPAFSYERQGRVTAMSYRQAPADLFEDRAEAAAWGRRAWEAAMRSGTPPRQPGKPIAKTPPRRKRSQT